MSAKDDKYNQSDKGRARSRRYEASPKGRDRQRRYRQSASGGRARFYQEVRRVARRHVEQEEDLR